MPSNPERALPADDHVHSEWSWDAVAGSMDATCARAVELGLPSVAFTEHADFTPWTIEPGTELPEQWLPLVSNGVLIAPELDVSGYLEALASCRDRYPSLRIVSGVELSEPHRHARATDELLARGGFERVLASVHSCPSPAGGDPVYVATLYEVMPADDVVRASLTETERLVRECATFEVLAHIDFPVRDWPSTAPPYDPSVHEEQYRHVLGLLASSDRVLEINTRVPLHPQVLTWWHQAGGAAVSFASDAHEPMELAAGFHAAVDVARSVGFRPDTRDPNRFWVRG